MKKSYDLKDLKWRANPYLKKLKKNVHIRLDQDVLDYFKSLALQQDVPYQTLINAYLRDCKENQLRPVTQWKKRA